MLNVCSLVSIFNNSSVVIKKKLCCNISIFMSFVGSSQVKSIFNHLLSIFTAFQYGCPPHGGFALGLDRILMILSGTENIRDVIAFPKTTSSNDLMSDAPNVVSKKQLKELGIKVCDEKNE